MNATDPTSPPPTLPLFHLEGDPGEAFYQLGRKDQAHFHQSKEHIEAILGPPDSILKFISAPALKLLALKVLKHNPQIKEVLGPYGEGLSYSLNSLVSLYLIPEAMSAINAFFPPLPMGLPMRLFGCSSFFLLDGKRDAPLHGRILDFPLVGSFEKVQRGISFRFPSMPQIWSHGLAGLPYPALTAMNSEGISLSIHQKFTGKFYSRGNLIFDICWRLLSEGRDMDSIIALLRKQRSLTTWGLYLGFKDGQVLAADICGEELHLEKGQLTPGKCLYYNNFPMGPEGTKNDILPFGMQSYCQMRLDSAHKKMGRFPPEHQWSEKDLIGMMASPFITRATHARNWKQDVVTFQTVASVVLNAKEGRATLVPGPAPQIISPELWKLEDLWEGRRHVDVVRTKSGLRAPSQIFADGMRHAALTTAYYDRKDLPLAYHHIQMSIECFEGHPEKFICWFFFLVYQYIHTPNAKDFAALLAQINELEGKLPSYLNDHALLFKGRLEIMMIGNASVTPDEITHPMLRKLWAHECKLPSLALKALRSLIFPQLGILDVLYGYFK